MGEHYGHLNDAERATIMVMLEHGAGVRAIARKLSRSQSTVSREIRRQPYQGALPYEATRAAAHAHWQRCQSRNRRKLPPGEPLFAAVAQRLRQGWSPLQIAGRLRRMHPEEANRRVCHETLYVALYALPRGA